MNIGDYTEIDRILFSCEAAHKREASQFVPFHVLGHIVSGSLQVYGEGKMQVFNEGDTAIFRANQLAKFMKQTAERGGIFKSINIFFDQQLLQNFTMEYAIKAEKPYAGRTIRLLKPSIILHNFFNSLTPYFNPSNKLSPSLTTLKAKEAIMLLLQSDNELKDMLFDFKQPGKIGLQEFMEQNFKFNVPMSRFAQLTGRSLAAFKRDFYHVFNKPPGKWLQERRLQEAYYLIKEKGKKSADIYLDMGFEDLSHFSFVFKKVYGVAPSLI